MDNAAFNIVFRAYDRLRHSIAFMHMRFRMGIGRLPLLGVLLFMGVSFRVIAQTNPVAKLEAPTGFYVSIAEISPAISMKLNTNGEYHVEIGPCGPLGCLSQTGKWKWDEQKREFLLTPRAPVDLWHFHLRRFRVDKQEPGALQWIPLDGGGNVLGVYSSIRFVRQDE
jgi:hypothetical protein